MDALEICDTGPVPLPLKVQATNLGYRIWLITSAEKITGGDKKNQL